MLDRASTFAHPEIVKLLKNRFIPVAIDQAYQRRQKDTEGDFYRKIAGQGPRNNFRGTTQGFYITTASGDLLLYNNNRDPEKVLRLMRQKLDVFQTSKASQSNVAAIEQDKVDLRFNVSPPTGGLVLRVHAKVLDGYEPTDDRWRRIFQSALSRDNLWISASEHKALVAGAVPESLQQRIARFHLVDNTRGEPPMWRSDEIRSVEMKLTEGRLEGTVHLRSRDGDREYTAELMGEIKCEKGQVIAFNMICLGDFNGEGRYTRGAPKGDFPLAIAFTLADGSDVADKIPPQGSRGWLRGYLP